MTNILTEEGLDGEKGGEWSNDHGQGVESELSDDSSKQKVSLDSAKNSKKGETYGGMLMRLSDIVSVCWLWSFKLG